MTKCIGCKKEFNNQGFPSHKKSCKLFKRAMRERLNKIPDYGAGPSTSNEEMVTEPAGEPADLGEMLVDDVQVPFSSPEN
jgi:inorganic pyrophosphatase